MLEFKTVSYYAPTEFKLSDAQRYSNDNALRYLNGQLFFAAYGGVRAIRMGTQMDAGIYGSAFASAC